jgi:hypothetical protein
MKLRMIPNVVKTEILKSFELTEKWQLWFASGIIT